MLACIELYSYICYCSIYLLFIRPNQLKKKMKEIKDKINNKAGHWYKIKWEHVIKYVENQQNKIVVAYRVNDKAEVFRLQKELYDI